MQKMKNSNIPWIGEIPESWKICRLKNYALICNGADHKAVADDNGQIPIMGSGGVFLYANTFIYDKPSVLLGRKGTIDKPLYVDYPFWTVDTMYYTKINEGYSIRFFYYLTLTINFDYYQYGSAVPSMTQKDLNNIKFPFPPLPTQTAIANFLDKKCTSINDTIAKQKLVIEKLKLYKQSVITEAVTKGLNPSVTMKDSGIEWIGEIPEGWETQLLKRGGQTVYTGTTPVGVDEKYYSSRGFPWYTPSDFKDGICLPLRTKRMLSNLGKNVCKIFCSNTVFLIGIGATIGKVAVSKCEASCNQQINAIVCKTLNPHFLCYYLQIVKDFLLKCGKFTTLPILNQEDTKNLIVPLPPLSEQNAIADHLDKKTRQIDNVISQKEALIEKLTTYKQSLIFEAVTGKMAINETLEAMQEIEEIQKNPNLYKSYTSADEMVKDLLK